MKKSELRHIIKEELSRVQINNRIKKLNKLIDKAKKDDIWAIDPDSTMEFVYEFKPIETKGKYLYFVYTEPFRNDKLNRDRFDMTDYGQLLDIEENFKWVERAIKKGYKDA